jgi:hypothetical protein
MFLVVLSTLPVSGNTGTRRTVNIYLRVAEIDDFTTTQAKRDWMLAQLEDALEYVDSEYWFIDLNIVKKRLDSETYEFDTIGDFTTFLNAYNDYNGDTDGQGRSSWRTMFAINQRYPSWHGISYGYLPDLDNWAAGVQCRYGNTGTRHPDFIEMTTLHEFGHGCELWHCIGADWQHGWPWFYHCVMKSSAPVDPWQSPCCEEYCNGHDNELYQNCYNEEPFYT